MPVMMLTRRNLLLAAPLAAAPTGLHLIAHRGGVVDESRSENSLGAIQEAIRQGYARIEVDIRSSKDGQPYLHHDKTLEKIYGVSANAEDLTWEELSALRTKLGGTAPVHFDALCELCTGKIALMLDFKTLDQKPSFYAGLAKSLKRRKLLANAYCLGGDDWFWKGKFAAGGARISRSYGQLQHDLSHQIDPSRTSYLFDLANRWKPEWNGFADALGVSAVAAVNTFRYTIQKRDEWLGPKEDITRLLAQGVRGFQIDSRYRPLFG
jgi:glycerophosphoryl diester phosphodiesterase